MSITSMTGFARAQGHDEGCTWAWEIKSVNGKGLEVRCRLPQGFDNLERASLAIRWAASTKGLAAGRTLRSPSSSHSTP